jgi:AcrR family transcriptional regulator
LRALTWSAARTEPRASALADLPPQDRLCIATAAVDVFVAHGYAGTTAAHLQTQIDPALFDALFADTEDCFLQVYDHLVDQATAHLAAAVSAENDTWPQRLADGLTAVFELIEANPSTARFLLVESQLATPDITARHYATIQACGRFMGEGRDLTSPPPLPLLDTVLPGGVASILAEHLSSHPDRPLTDLYADLLQILLLPYLGKTQTTAFLITRPTGAPHA